MGQEQGGNILVHERLIIGKLYVGHGLGNGQTSFKNRLRKKAHAGTRQGAVSDKLYLILWNIRQKSNGNGLVDVQIVPKESWRQYTSLDQHKLLMEILRESFLI